MQFLISGHIDEGLATLRTVLATVDMTLPRHSPPVAGIAAVAAGTAALRGLRFRERDLSEIAAADLTRIDVCWSAAVGLSVVDTIRGADFQARGLLLSLDEPSRRGSRGRWRWKQPTQLRPADRTGRNQRGCWEWRKTWPTESTTRTPWPW